MKTSFSAFQCVDGVNIHISDLHELTLFKYDNVEFIFVNNRRLINNKINKRLMQIIFPYLVYSGKKLTIKVSQVIEEDLNNINYEQ